MEVKISLDNKETVGINQKSPQKEDNAEKETYRFFDYIKEKPSIAIAIGSAVIAVGTALLNLLAYLIDKRYLAFWNVSEDFIQINSIKTIYFIFALILTSTFSVIFQIWSTNIIQKHFKCVKPTIVVDEVLNSLKETIKNDKKLISQRRTELRKIGANEKESSEENTTSCLEKQIEELENQNRKLKKETEDIRKDSRKEARKYKVLLFAMIGIMVFAQTIITLVYMWITDSSTNNVIVPSIIISSTMIVPFCVFKYFYHRKRLVNDIKNDLKNKNYKEIIGEDKEDSVGRIRQYFSDNAFKNILLYTIIVLLTTIVVTYFYSSAKCKAKNEFYIFEDDESQYVYIYENDDCMILEKAEIDEDNNTIIIYATEQYFIDKTSIKFEFRKFEKVDYVRYK